jgi:MFS family permease
MLAGTLMSLLFNLGLANSQTYAQALICRLFGYGTASAGLCITPAAISDLFFFHEKGKRIGMNTFLLIVAPYLGGAVGGSIQYNPELGWRWAMYIAAIMYAGLFVMLLLFGKCSWYSHQRFPADISQYQKLSTTARPLSQNLRRKEKASGADWDSAPPNHGSLGRRPSSVHTKCSPTQPSYSHLSGSRSAT